MLGTIAYFLYILIGAKETWKTIPALFTYIQKQLRGKQRVLADGGKKISFMTFEAVG